MVIASVARVRHGFAFLGRLPSLIALAFLSFPQSPQAADGLSPQQISEIQQLSTQALARDRLPGLAVAVGQGDQVNSFGFGHADVENQAPVTASSMFRTASISKWLTATAALRLVDDGKLDLDAPIQKYCPHYPEQKWTITARLLLSHLSGIRHYHGQNGEAPATDAEKKLLQERIAIEQSKQLTRYTDVTAPIDNFKHDPLLFQPGTRQSYTSMGYVVLACVLEGAAQKPYRTLLQELVLAPAGMKSTRDDDALAIIAHRVDGYSRNTDGTLARARFRDVSANLPAGGHLATAEDLVHFALAFHAGKLVRPATRDRMMERPNLVDGTDVANLPPVFGIGANAYYGMGVMVGSVNGQKVIMHSGSQPGTSTELLLAPESGVAIAVMANMNGWSGAHALATQILDVVRKR